MNKKAPRSFRLYHEIPANAEVNPLLGGERPTHVRLFVYFSDRGYYNLSFANVRRKIENGMMCEAEDLDCSGKNAMNLGDAPRFSAKTLDKIREKLACQVDTIGMMWLNAGLNESLKILVKQWASQ